MKSLLRWLLRIVGGLVLLGFLLLAAVTFLKIPIDLTNYKEPVETIASKVLKRPVAIEDSIVISTSLTPEFSLGGLRIGNPDGFSEDTFMYLESARIQIQLLPLLGKKVHISELSVQKLHVNLVEQEGGAVNWTFGSGSEGTVEPETQESTTPDQTISAKREITGDSIVLEKLVLSDIAVKYYKPGNPEPFTHLIDKCTGSMLPGKPLGLDINGSHVPFPYNLEVSISSLDELLTDNRSWVDIQAAIAGANVHFGGDINLVEAHRSLALKTKFSGENLSSLNDLLHLDLPPLAAYSLTADLFLKKDQFVLKNLTVKTGSSSLSGTADITKTGDKVEAVIDFSSPLIQIDDFTFDDWSWSGEDTEAAAGKVADGDDGTKQTAEVEQVAGENDESTGKTNRNLFDPELLSRFNVALTIRSEQVLSGDDQLGSGLLKATALDGRIALDPLEMKVPGGSIRVAASVKPGTDESDAAFKAVMSNFDISILARRSKPESKMGGLVNLDIDLQSSASSPQELLENGNGYLDFSGNLENLAAGVIDLWAVNLVAAIVSSTEENQSTINCAVGRWTVRDGVLTPDVFFIDTSKIRICGKGQIDLRKGMIDLIIAPSAKKPEFFNLATPLEVHGSFSDINLGVQKGGVVGTALKFITSPVHVPLRRVFADGVPEDGGDACTIELGPDNRSEVSIEGCR